MKERTPQEVREVTERDYRDWMGLDADTAHKLAMADFELVEAARRAGDINETKAAPQPKKQIERPDEVKKAERDKGVKLVTPEPSKFERIGLLHADPTTIDEAWALCMGRIRRICEGSDPVAKTYKQAVAGCTVPHLAYRVLETLAFFWLRNMAGSTRLTFGAGHAGSSDHNPFRSPHTGETLNDIDAARKLRRIFEDIADQSSGVMGTWRIPK